MNLNEKMREQIKQDIVPYLRSIGFKGSYPHFRRNHEVGIDLVTFQSDKWGNPSFCIEYGFTSQFITSDCGPSRTKTPKNLSTIDLKLPNRRRLNPRNVDSKSEFADYWYSFSEGSINQCVEQVASDLQIPVAWWFKMTDEARATPPEPAVVGNVKYLVDGQVVCLTNHCF